MFNTVRYAVLATSVFLAAGISTSAAEQSSKAPAESPGDTAMGHAIKHQDPRYVCPMHPQIVRDQPGSCPICGMDLVEKSAEKSSETHAEATGETAMGHAIKHQDPRYVCPMHPQIVRDQPGSCPICGMDLVPVKDEGGERESGGASAYPAITVAPGIRQSLGLRTAKAELRDMHIEIRTPGSVDYDETRMTHIHPRAAGWFEKLHVRAVGDPVKAGELLGEFYSPEILAAQVDFLVALDSSQRGKLDSARNGLRLLGVPEKTIQLIETRRKTQNRVPVVAPASGIITSLGAREGMYVMPASETFAITDLDHVWVKVDVYEHQIAALQEGLKAEIRLPAWPERVWQGIVEYIYPQLNAVSRTLSLRLGFDNPDHLLKPGMFAEAIIKAQPKNAVVVIPQQALIITGERQAVVKVLADGRFQPVDVVPGITQDGMTEITSGIAAGDEVVVSGQFLIDSESALQASFLRLSGE